MPEDAPAKDETATRDQEAPGGGALVPVGAHALALSVYPELRAESSPIYAEFMADDTRCKILHLVRRACEQHEKLLDDVVDALLEVDPQWSADAVFYLKNVILLGANVRRRRKRQKIIREVVRSLLEKLFDPALEFRMTRKDILDTFEACGLKRSEVADDLVGEMYVVVLHKLSVGELRDLLHKDEVFLRYASLKIRELGYSRLGWEVSGR